MSASDSVASDHLWAREERIVELEGVVHGYTRWSSIGGLLGILAGLSVPRVFGLPFWIGIISIVVVVTVVFLLVYYFVGRRLAAQSKPPSESPYVTLVLTDRRILVLDRGLGAEEPILLEETPRADVSEVRHRRARPLLPHRLNYVVGSGERREFEFPRSQQVGKFARDFR